MKCRKCSETVRVEMCRSSDGYFMGYYCSSCHEYISLTKAFSTADQARKAWDNR